MTVGFGADSLTADFDTEVVTVVLAVVLTSDWAGLLVVAAFLLICYKILSIK
jgi:hypothetical protein